MLSIALTRVLPAILLNKSLFFIGYKITGNACIVDVAWAFSHLVAGGVYGYHAGGFSSLESKIKLFVLTLWTLRLGGFLFYNRILGNVHDPRYEAIFKKYEKLGKRDVIVFTQFMIQGLLVVFTSSTLYYLFNSKLNTVNAVFLGAAALGIVLEGVADQQLETFKATNKVKGAIFQQGLWTHSRHPNLFFDLTTWFSFALASQQGVSTLYALLGPAFLYFIMNKLTVPVTEKVMKNKRGDSFIEYQKKTNKFWPF